MKGCASMLARCLKKGLIVLYLMDGWKAIGLHRDVVWEEEKETDG